MERECGVYHDGVALRLEAQRASGSPTVIEITWTELSNAPIGRRWVATGGGVLFTEIHAADLVCQVGEYTVVVVQRYYADDNRTEDNRVVHVFRL